MPDRSRTSAESPDTTPGVAGKLLPDPTSEMVSGGPRRCPAGAVGNWCGPPGHQYWGCRGGREAGGAGGGWRELAGAGGWGSTDGLAVREGTAYWVGWVWGGTVTADLGRNLAPVLRT